MSALRSSRVWTFLTVLLSLVAFAAADQDPLVFIIGVPAACIAWLITSGSPTRAMPRFVINVLLFFVVAWGSLTTFREGLGVSLFSEFVAALMIIKLLDRRTCRDSAQIITLSVFLSIGAVLTSNSFWLGLLLLLYIPVIISAVLWHQLARVEERTESTADDTPSLRWRTRRRTAIVFAAAVGIATSAFLLMPREIGSKTLGAWGAAAVGSVVGFNDEVKLGKGGLISESRETVLDLQLFSRADEPMGSIGRRFYLRGAVLDTYDTDTGTWTRGDSQRNKYQQGPPPLTRHSPVAVGGKRPEDWSVRQEITIRNVAGERGHLFSIWRTNRVRVDPPARLVFCIADSTLQVQGHSGKVAYTVYSNTQEPIPVRWEEHSDTDRRDVMLDLPAVRDLAWDILREAGIEPDPTLRSAARDNQAVSLLKNYFSAGDFQYTLDTLSAPPGRDPIEWFLTDNREGHCEYYASAMAALCRTVGIDARVVTGYVATDYNTTTSSYMVRASNAHAWVEAETLPGHWRLFDPTPSADLTRIHEPPRGLLAGARRFIDTIEFAWIRTVVSYDADSRSDLLGKADADVSMFPLLDRLAGIADSTREAPSALLLQAGRNSLVTFFIALMLGAAYIRSRHAIMRWVVRMIRWIASMFMPGMRQERSSPAQMLHGELLGLYRRAGQEKPGWVPLRTHTESLSQKGVFAGNTGQAAARLSQLLYAAFFREDTPDEDQIRAARADLAVVKGWATSRGRKSLAEAPRHQTDSTDRLSDDAPHED